MTEPFDPDEAAAILAGAWRSGGLLRELPPAARPATMDQGYDIQDRFIADLDEEILGWKLGLGSHLQKRQFGIGRSVAGRLLATHVHENGAAIQRPNAAPVTIEFEIAYVLARDIRPDDEPFAPLDAVSETRVTFELLLSRFVDRLAVGWPSFAADNAGFHALVLGPVIDPTRIAGLVEGLVVKMDGKPMARSLTDNDATDPVAAFSDLIAIARERRMKLPKGSIISTGTVSKPFGIVAKEAEISAEFLGTSLEFRLVAQH